MAKKLGGISADLGLLILRIGVGVVFVIHGWPKITGGVEAWRGYGEVMSNFGINFLPVFWGFMAAVAEFVGGIAIALGICTKISSLLILAVMIVAASFHISTDTSPEYPMFLATVMISLFFMGSGRFGFDLWLWGPKSK